MISVDVVKTNTVIRSFAECENRMKHLCNDVYEITRQLNETNGLYKFVSTLDTQLGEMQEDARCLRQLTERLEQIVSSYVACEEKNAVFVEESQASIGRYPQFMEYEIPEGLFRILGNG